jgi:hypothetical protein
MILSLHRYVRAAGPCHQQGQQRCAATRVAFFSVWNKKTGAGNQI